MTAPARISQADMQRAVKAARKVGGKSVIIDLANQRLEIVLGEAANGEDESNPWEDDDA